MDTTQSAETRLELSDSPLDLAFARDAEMNRPGFLGDSIPWKRGWRHGRPTEAVPD